MKSENNNNDLTPQKVTLTGLNGVTNIEGDCVQMGKLVVTNISFSPSTGTLQIKHDTEYITGFPSTTKFYNRIMGILFCNNAQSQPPCVRFILYKKTLSGYFNGGSEYISNAQPVHISMAYFADNL